MDGALVRIVIPPHRGGNRRLLLTLPLPLPLHLPHHPLLDQRGYVGQSNNQRVLIAPVLLSPFLPHSAESLPNRLDGDCQCRQIFDLVRAPHMGRVRQHVSPHPGREIKVSPECLAVLLQKPHLDRQVGVGKVFKHCRVDPKSFGPERWGGGG